MKIPARVKKYLNSKKLKYEIVNHKTVYTAYDKAATLRIKPNAIGKTLVLKAGSDLVIVVIPGNKNLDLVKLKKLAKAKKIDFISEKVLKNKFKGVKFGSIPPFGEIYKLQVYMERGLMKEKNILVNTGIYESSFKVSPKIFEKLGAIIGNFSKAKK